MADDDLKAEVERLKAENERLKSQRGRNASLKVSEKGGVSVYGLGRFPVTLYKEQVDQTARDGRRDQGVHRSARRRAEGQAGGIDTGRQAVVSRHRTLR